MKKTIATQATKLACTLLALGLTASVVTTANAQLISTGASVGLERAGPIDPQNGFPQWYQDKTGLALELLTPKSAAELAAGYNVVLATDTVYPEVFPSSWFVEHFYFMARSVMTVPVSFGNGQQSGRCTVSCAQEASFGGGFVKAGDQIAFTRIRIDWRGVPYNGTYIIETPYSTNTFTGVLAGDRIFNTEDIGFAPAPAGFQVSLNTKVGPYLVASATPGGAELPPVTFEGRSYLANPGTLTKVTGSPLGADRNGVRIWYVGPTVGTVTPAPVLLSEASDWSLFGRIKTGTLPSRTQLVRASRTFAATDKRIDICATGDATLAPRLVGAPYSVKATPVLTAYMAPPIVTNGVLSAPARTATVVPILMDKSGTQFSCQSPQYATRAAIPTAVTVTDATGGVYTVPVTDSIVIVSATYNSTTKVLTVNANPTDNGSTLSFSTRDGPLSMTKAGNVYTHTALPFAPCDIYVTSNQNGANSAEVVPTKK